MKRWVKFILTLSLLGVILLFNSVYEPFPVKSVSKTEVLKKVSQANGKIVKIDSNHQNYQWYISINENADDNLIQIMKDKGWSFVKKESTLYFFEGEQGNIIVNSEVWNKKYTIFHFPEGI